MVKPYVPDRGDIVWLDFNPTRGHEQKGKRPALVISRKIYNVKTSLLLACPITSHAKGYDFEVTLPDTSAVHGVVLADHVRSLDWHARKAKFAGRASAPVIAQTIELLAVLVQN